MKKYRTPWNLILIMSSLASSLLVIPPEAKARMIASRMQSGRTLALVRQQLCSEVMQQQIKRFGLSMPEADQIQAVFSDESVLREMVRMEGRIGLSTNTTVEPGVSSRLITALQSSVERHMAGDLQKKLSDRAKSIPDNQRLIASRLSTSGGTVDARTALAEARRMLTAETLVSLGMTRGDAAETLAKLKGSDIDNIFKGGLRIGYAAGLDFSSEEGQLLVVIIILVIIAAIAGGTAAAVLLIIALIVLIYLLMHGHL